jgi:hypothetical protein
MEREEAHHDPGRAEAALGAVMGHYRGLHRMEAVLARKVLDRDQLGPVELSQEIDAGIHRLVGKLALAQARERHRAGAAIALGATLLRAEAALVETQVVEQVVLG